MALFDHLSSLFRGTPEQREVQELQELYQRVHALFLASPYADDEAVNGFVHEIIKEVERRAELRLPQGFDLDVMTCVYDLTGIDPVFFWWLTTPPQDLSSDESIQYRHFLLTKERVLSQPSYYEEIWREKVIRIVLGIVEYLRPHLEAVESYDLEPPRYPFSTKITNLCNVPEIVERVIMTFFDDDLEEAGLFVRLRNHFDERVATLSGGPRDAKDLITPTKSKLPWSEIPRVYFQGTPFAELFEKTLPFPLKDNLRFQHQFVVAPPGSGKTQLLQAQIASDLERVIKGEASIVVIDSQGVNEETEGKDRTLLQNIINLKLFAPGQPLEGKLVYIRPSRDLALNIFDMGQHAPGASERQKEVLRSSAYEMISYCLSGDTEQQRQMIQYIVRLAMQVPGATIDTVRRILTTPEKKFEEAFGDALNTSTRLVQDYFRQTFFSGGRTPTKDAVLARVMGMLSSEVFAEMFSHTHNDVHLLDDIEAGKVIVINTDKELLKRFACEAFGRFFIALLQDATRQRKTAKPVFCYIDECQDYIAADENIAEMLLQVRKQKVGLVLATQLLANITSHKVRTALSSVAIKMAGRNTDEAGEVARVMSTTPDYITKQTTGTFATFVQDVTRHGAITIDVPGFVMEKMERMTAEEFKVVHAKKRPPLSFSPPTVDTPMPSLIGPNVTDVEPDDDVI